MREETEWVILGFSEEITMKISTTLMDDEYSYWFHYRSIPWYRIRRVKGIDPMKTLLTVLDRLQVVASVRRDLQKAHLFAQWIIESLDVNNA